MTHKLQIKFIGKRLAVLAAKEEHRSHTAARDDGAASLFDDLRRRRDLIFQGLDKSSCWYVTYTHNTPLTILLHGYAADCNTFALQCSVPLDSDRRLPPPSSFRPPPKHVPVIHVPPIGTPCVAAESPSRLLDGEREMAETGWAEAAAAAGADDPFHDDWPHWGRP